MLSCPADCGYEGKSLAHHYRWSLHCRPSTDDDPKAAKRRRDSSVAAQLFTNRVAGVMGKALLCAHVDQYCT